MSDLSVVDVQVLGLDGKISSLHDTALSPRHKRKIIEALEKAGPNSTEVRLTTNREEFRRLAVFARDQSGNVATRAEALFGIIQIGYSAFHESQPTTTEVIFHDQKPAAVLIESPLTTVAYALILVFVPSADWRHVSSYSPPKSKSSSSCSSYTTGWSFD